jgi:hypothetical protein
MSLLSDDPLTQLAFTLHENRGVYALLLGSGVSRAAEIPTGWEIIESLIRRIGLVQGAEEQSDWFAWYRERTGEEPNYSTLLEELAASPDDRRAILHPYIEPTEADREARKKTPTAAHYAIADLVGNGNVRVIVTTNFDRLLESALRERGIEPTVVASVDAVLGAEPLAHSRCYVLKLHGDYKDARIRNTEGELGGYPAELDRLLDRILDEYGLVVCGWSGDWDLALRAALLRAPNRRFSTFWTARGDLNDSARQLVAHRRARVVPISDADGFFSALRDRVETLAATERLNPLSVQLIVETTKRLLQKHESRIQLDDLFAAETERLVAILGGAEFPISWNSAELPARVGRYEAASEPLVNVAGAIGRWGDDHAVGMATEAITSLHQQARKIRHGYTTVQIGIRSYPAVLAFTALGLGLTRAERWAPLHRLFSTIVGHENGERLRVVDSLFLYASGDWGDVAVAWPRSAPARTPLSDHLLGLFSEWSKRFVGLTADFEAIFEKFEVLGALAFLEKTKRAEIQAVHSSSRDRFSFIPVGRASWHDEHIGPLLSDLKSGALRSELVAAGFGGGDVGMLDLFVENFNRVRAQRSFGL